MKMKHYFEAQNDRWHEQYLNSEKLLSEAEDALCQLEHLALKHISDEAVRAEIAKIVDQVWRGVRP
jgi:hypothetical protein